MKTRWLAVLLVLVALAPRLVGLNQFATWDELFWTHASLRFWRAAQSGAWPRTYVIGQPGVVQMWLGSAAVSLKGWLGGEAVWEASRAAGRPRYAPDDLTMLGAVADEWPTVTPLTALFTALAVGGVYLLLRRLVGTRAALVGALLLAFDPFFLAHSRVMALDAVLASLMTLSLLAWLVYLWGGGGRRYLVLAAVLGGLGALQKTTGVFVLGYVGLTLLVRWGGALWGRRDVIDDLAPSKGGGTTGEVTSPLPPPALLGRGQGVGSYPFVKTALLPGLAWAVVAALTYVVVWPAMWTTPRQTLGALYQTLTAYAPTAYDPTFFMGEATVAPGALFYPLVALFRTAPLTWLGLAGLAWRAWRREPGLPWRTVGALLLYALLFGVALSLSAAKFDRYLLPALVPLVLVAGVGLGASSSQYSVVSSQYGIRPSPYSLILVVLFVIQTFSSLRFHPYTLAWYNPLLGGQAAAERVLPLGWGEGVEGAAHFLAAQPGAETARVATWGAVGLAPWFRGQIVLPEKAQPWRDADYLAVYITDRQRDDAIAQVTASLTPVYVGRVGGLDYVWVYRGPVK